MSKPIFKVVNQSLIDFEIKKDGESIGWIYKIYVNDKNSGPCFYKGVAYGCDETSFDKSFHKVKKFVMENGTKLEHHVRKINLQFYVSGMDAFKDGLPRAPASNAKFISLVEKYPQQNEGAAHNIIMRMNHYLKGWDDANLAAPVEGWTEEENKNHSTEKEFV